jgi:hypothetical protein
VAAGELVLSDTGFEFRAPVVGVSQRLVDEEWVDRLDNALESRGY